MHLRGETLQSGASSLKFSYRARRSTLLSARKRHPGRLLVVIFSCGKCAAYCKHARDKATVKDSAHLALKYFA